MNDAVLQSFDGVEQQSLHEFTEKAYLNYSMYVILDRALPHIADGLKPVQRRIVYAMSELGLKATAKYKKSARTVGDVLGKFHPHGDSACYEAMVLMAQDFSYRYPLVDGQGNWGSPDDPKSFAAMRYTESRLAGYAEVLLSEANQGTVDWIPNFDGTLREPALLPAKLPNVLLNGSTGIAVGMATDVPPHNLTEVANACIHLLENPKADLDAITEIIQAPDYPTAAEIITPRADIKEIYAKGNGTIKMRAVYEKEQDEIVITALPHQVSGSKLIEQIAQQMQAKKLPMVADLRDESDHENPTRIVIVPRSNRIDVDALMSHLFATTDLERNYRINMNMIGLDGKPQLKNLLQIIKEWLVYREQTTRRRLQYRLDKVLERLHILEGLLVAYLNIDEVIRIIREEDDPKQELMARYKLSDLQADAILDIKLRHLAKLEEIKIRGEQDELNKERVDLEKTLGSTRRMRTLMKKEIQEAMEKYGDKRRSPLVLRMEAQAMKEEQRIPSEAVTIVLSNKGWVRSAKGHEVDAANLNYKSGDSLLMTALGKSNQPVAFLDSAGRSYALSAHTLPSARGQGEPLTTNFTPPAGATFKAVLAGEAEQYYVLATTAGYGFVTQLQELFVRNKKGKAMLSVPNSAEVLTPVAIHNLESQYIVAVSSDGRMLVFPLAELPVLSKGKGNKIIDIATKKFATGDEQMIAMLVVSETDAITLHAGKRHYTMKFADLSHYQGERGRRGSKLPRGFQRVEKMTMAE